MAESQNNEQFDRDKDVITPEEFEELEKKEAKKSLIKRLLKKSKDTKQNNDDNKNQKNKNFVPLSQNELVNEFYSLNSRFDNLLVDLEKLSGKLDMEVEARTALNERIVDLSSQIGELRSVIITKEKFFDRVEIEYEKMKEIIQSIKPEAINAKFDNLQKQIVKNDASIEKIESKLQQFERSIESLREKLNKLGSFENLIDNLSKMDSNLKRISHIEAHIERLTTKSESIYLELTEKLKILDGLDMRVKSLEKSTLDISKKIDELKVKLQSTVKKDEFNKLSHKVDVIKKDLFKKDLKMFIEILNTKKKAVDVAPIDNRIKTKVEKIEKEEEEIKKEIPIMTKESNKELLNEIPSYDEFKKKRSKTLPPHIIKLCSFLKRNLSKIKDLDAFKKKLVAKGWSEKEINACINLLKKKLNK